MSNNKQTYYKILHRFFKFSAWDNEKKDLINFAEEEEVESQDFEKCLYFNRPELEFEFYGTRSTIDLKELKEVIRKVEENPDSKKYSTINFEVLSESDGHYNNYVICGERMETDEELNERIKKNEEYNKKREEEKRAKKAERELRAIEKAKAILEKHNAKKQGETK